MKTTHKNIISKTRSEAMAALATLKQIRFDTCPADLDVRAWEKLINASEYLTFALNEMADAVKVAAMKKEQDFSEMDQNSHGVKGNYFPDGWDRHGVTR